MPIRLKPKEKAIFLKEFTKAILKTIAEKEKGEREEEKIKKKLKEEFPSEIQLEPSQIFQGYEASKQIISKASTTSPDVFFQKPLLQTPAVPKVPKTSVKPHIIKKVSKAVSPHPFPISSPSLSVESKNLENPLEKIKFIFRDPSVSSVECPGPGKNLLVKRYNKIYSTRIVLNEEEIKNIIEEFSEKSRIPLVGGMLKAVVDNFVIFAVTSEVIGSRFIIKKI